MKRRESWGISYQLSVISYQLSVGEEVWKLSEPGFMGFAG